MAATRWDQVPVAQVQVCLAHSKCHRIHHTILNRSSIHHIRKEVIHPGLNTRVVTVLRRQVANQDNHRLLVHHRTVSPVALVAIPAIACQITSVDHHHTLNILRTNHISKVGDLQDLDHRVPEVT